ncbi:MAG: apolipoprotein N-acyltransferase [Turneriella sp.]|nr:apolipoprotein N-acyltransferase [Turneriella sp.]
MRRALFWAALSALFSALSFAPFHLFPLGFVSLLPIFYVFENFSLRPRQVVAIWLVWILLINLIGYHWILHTIAVYGMMPKIVALPIFLLYALGTGGKMLLFFFLLYALRRHAQFFHNTALRTATVVAGFALCEFLGWQLFPWYGANLVSADLAFIQGADLIGVRGMSLLWMLIQYLAYLVFCDLRKNVPWQKALRQSSSLRVLVVVLVVTHAYGLWALAYFRAREQAAPKVFVGVPQGNVPLITSYHERPYIIARMVAQTQKLVADAKAQGVALALVIWPESSIPAMEFERSAELQRAIAELQRATQVPIFINDIYHDPRTRRDYSNMWHLDKDGRPLASYQKNYLLPFGEFMPLGDIFPVLKRIFPAVSDFSPGENFALFAVNTPAGTLHALPLICYEVILPDYARRFDRDTGHAAQFIANITNDAWFGESYESLQHLLLGSLRAVELRIPIVRATNSGITAYISATGEVSGTTGLFERTNRIYAVPVLPRWRSVYALCGNWPIVLFCAVVAIILLFRMQHQLRH